MVSEIPAFSVLTDTAFIGEVWDWTVKTYPICWPAMKELDPWVRFYTPLFYPTSHRHFLTASMNITYTPAAYTYLGEWHSFEQLGKGKIRRSHHFSLVTTQAAVCWGKFPALNTRSLSLGPWIHLYEKLSPMNCSVCGLPQPLCLLTFNYASHRPHRENLCLC